MTLPELPALRPYATRGYSPSMKHAGKPTAYAAKSVEARERILVAEIERLRAECEAMRADAERYRWLRRKACVVMGGQHLYGPAEFGEFEFLNMPRITDCVDGVRDSASALDSAIDAARSAP